MKFNVVKHHIWQLYNYLQYMINFGQFKVSGCFPFPQVQIDLSNNWFNSLKQLLSLKMEHLMQRTTCETYIEFYIIDNFISHVQII